MIVTCDKCRKSYNDEYRWTICPHHKLGENPGMTTYEYTQFVREKQADQGKILQRLFRDDEYRLKAMQLDNAARGMAGDVGEVNSCVQKFIEYGKPLDEVNLIEELGDVLWRICQAADAIGKNLQDVIDANVRKLNARYKGKLTEHEALNRNLEAEKAAIKGESGTTWLSPTATSMGMIRPEENVPIRTGVLEVVTKEIIGVETPLVYDDKAPGLCRNPHTEKIPRPSFLVGKSMKPKFQVHPLYWDEDNVRIVVSVNEEDGTMVLTDVRGEATLREHMDQWYLSE